MSTDWTPLDDKILESLSTKRMTALDGVYFFERVYEDMQMAMKRNWENRYKGVFSFYRA